MQGTLSVFSKTVPIIDRLYEKSHFAIKGILFLRSVDVLIA